MHGPVAFLSDKAKVQTGETTTGTVSVPAASTGTISIALNRSDYKFGTVGLYIPTSASASTLKQRMTSLIMVTTADADAFAQSTAYREEVILNGSGYYSFTVWQHRGYRFSTDSLLSEANYTISGAGTLRIDSARINGSNLEIVVRNTSGVFAGSYNFNIRWRVFTP